MSSSMPPNQYKKRDNDDNHCAPAKRTKTMEDRGNTLQSEGGPPVIFIDHDGDLRLRVSDEIEPFTQEFVVCSRTLARSSPVWQELVQNLPSNSEADNTGKELIIDLPRNACRPLSILLHASHGRFEQVPEDLDELDLYDLLVLANEYRMVGIIKPWVKKWHKAVRRISPQTSPSLIYIAWALGDLPMLEKHLRYWTHHASNHVPGVISLLGRHCPPDLQALEAFKKILPTRKHIVASMVETWHAEIEKLLQQSSGPCHDACKASHHNVSGAVDCGALILGRLKIREYSILKGLCLPKDYRMYRGTIETLKELFSMDGISSFDGAMDAPPRESTGCCASIQLVQLMRDRALGTITHYLDNMVPAEFHITLRQNAEETGSLARREVHAPAMQ